MTSRQDFLLDKASLGCLQLSSINFPKRIKEISNMAFQDCASLSNFASSDSLQKISNWAFKICYSLSRISLSAAVNDIDNQAFAGCDNVKELEVSEANTTYAAKDNSNLSRFKIVEEDGVPFLYTHVHPSNK